MQRTPGHWQPNLDRGGSWRVVAVDEHGDSVDVVRCVGGAAGKARGRLVSSTLGVARCHRRFVPLGIVGWMAGPGTRAERTTAQDGNRKRRPR